MIYQKSNVETQTCKIEGKLTCEIWKKKKKKEPEDRKEAKVKINKSFTFTENSRALVLMRNINSVVKTDSKSSDIWIWTQNLSFSLYTCTKRENK